MTHQSDYGTAEDKALVPGGLVVYRHFQVDLATGRLHPMNWRGPTPSSPYVDWVSEPTYPPGASEPYQAACNRILSHQAPLKGCSCGFYASYDPDTDFYPGYQWTGGRFGDPPIVIVKAAVEMSGTVIMGRLGVRAQKMKILGMTIDWSKQKKTPPQEINDLLADAGAYDVIGMPYHNPDTDTLASVISVAHAYGARYHDTLDALAEAHGVADVEALGVDTTPRAMPYFGGYVLTAAQVRAMQVQFNASAQKLVAGLKDATIALRDAFDISFLTAINQGKPKQRRKAKKVVDNAVAQAAIEMKRNRPAPPGAGIDRRRGRLR